MRSLLIAIAALAIATPAWAANEGRVYYCADTFQTNGRLWPSQKLTGAYFQ